MFFYYYFHSDKHGKLKLSPKQKERFCKWARPEDFCDNPQMVYAISSFSIRQVGLFVLILFGVLLIIFALSNSDVFKYVGMITLIC